MVATHQDFEDDEDFDELLELGAMELAPLGETPCLSCRRGRQVAGGMCSWCGDKARGKFIRSRWQATWAMVAKRPKHLALRTARIVGAPDLAALLGTDEALVRAWCDTNRPDSAPSAEQCEALAYALMDQTVLAQVRPTGGS